MVNQLWTHTRICLVDLYSWLESHSGLSRSSVTKTASAIEANTSSLNTDKTSSSSRSYSER